MNDDSSSFCAPVADASKVKKRKTEMGHGSLHGKPGIGYGSPLQARKSKVKQTVNSSKMRTIDSPDVGSETEKETPPVTPKYDRASLRQPYQRSPIDTSGHRRKSRPSSNGKSRNSEWKEEEGSHASVPIGLELSIPDLGLGDSAGSETKESVNKNRHPMNSGNSKARKSVQSMSPRRSHAKRISNNRHASLSGSPRYSKVGPSSPSEGRRSQRKAPRQSNNVKALNIESPSTTKTDRNVHSQPSTWHSTRDSRRVGRNKVKIMVPDLDSSDDDGETGITDGPGLLSTSDNRFPASRKDRMHLEKKAGTENLSRSDHQYSAHRKSTRKSSAVKGDEHVKRPANRLSKSEHDVRRESKGARHSSVSHSYLAGTSRMSKSEHVRDKRYSSRPSSAGHAPANGSSKKSSERMSSSAVKRPTQVGLVGSVVGMMDRVLQATVALPESKYGKSDDQRLENANSLQKDDDSGSFANEDCEANYDHEDGSIDEAIPKRKSGMVGSRNESKTTVSSSLREEAATKLQESKSTSKALLFMEKTFGIERKPSRTLILIWSLIIIELAFDFVTNFISFMAFTRVGDCCGSDVNLGRLPLGVTIPFFVLVMGETVFLFIAITISLWPSILNRDDSSGATWGGRLSCCFRWNATRVLNALNITVVLNPFFGCVIAWMLLYQSDRVESFVVLGLEAATIVLHFLSVWLDGSCRTWRGVCFHCIQLVPFLTSVVLIFWYLKQGGICYVVSQEKFLFSGCELCPDDTLPLPGGFCEMPDGTKVQVTNQRVWDIEGDFSDLAGAFVSRSSQATYCASDHPEGPEDVNFCFFPYGD